MNIRVNPRIRWRWEKDKMLLNTMLGMNRVAGEVLEFCETSSTVDEVTEKMVEKYPDVPYEQLHRDIVNMIDVFLKRGILLSSEDEEPLMFTPYFMEYIDSFFHNQLSAPVRVACEITSACNAHCMHCYASFEDDNELSTAQWKTILDHLTDINVFGVSFTGGEPLLRKDLEEIVEYASKTMRTTLATNGFLLTKERIESLRRAGIDAIMISLDGATPHIHDQFRGIDGLFEQVVKAVTYLVKMKIDVGILTTISRLNVTHIPDMMKLADNLGAPRLALMRFIISGKAVNNRELEPSPQEYIELLNTIHKTEKELKTTSVLYPDLPALFYEKSIGLDYYEALKVQGAVELCGAGITTCAISPTGEVKPCDVSGNTSLGNVTTQLLKDIWDTSDVLKTLRTLKKKDQNPCSQCRLSHTCLTGCKALPSQVEGDLYAVDPTCAACFTLLQEV